MLKKDFLLALHADWLRHLTALNAELSRAAARDRATTLARAGKAAEWLAHYARLLRDGHGVRV
jgi:hypothetical protein